jgi:hypothetical protein
MASHEVRMASLEVRMASLSKGWHPIMKSLNEKKLIPSHYHLLRKKQRQKR